MGNDKRQEYCAEIKRLKEACRKTKSKYLKNDYGKRIKRMKKQLAYYDYCHKNRRKVQWQPITDRSQTEARQPVNTTRLAETPKTASVVKDTARRPKMTNDEAISILKDLSNYTVNGYSFMEVKEAVRLAVRALTDRQVMDNFLQDMKDRSVKGEIQ